MIKKPDLSEIAKKLDLNNLVGNIKSLLNPEATTPDVDPDDAIGVKIAQLSLMMQQLSKTLDQCSKDFNHANQLLNELYVDIEALRHSAKEPQSSSVDEPDQKK